MMSRSNHPLLVLGICALSASHAVALSNDIQSPHRLFRLRKSALNGHGSNEMDAMKVPNETVDVQTFVDDGENTTVESLVEAVVETQDNFDTSRQKDDDGLLSMNIGGVDDTEFQECEEVMVCPDPACEEMVEIDIEEPTLFNRKNLLLRRHLESKTNKSIKEHKYHSPKSDKSSSTAETPVYYESMITDDVATTSKIPPTTGDTAHEEHRDQVAKSGKAATTASALPITETPASESTIMDDVETVAKSGKAATTASALPIAEMPVAESTIIVDVGTVAKSGKAATTASALPIAEMPIAESTIMVDVGTVAKSGKVKSDKMTPPDSQSPHTNGDPATTILPSTEAFLTKSGKVSKSTKGCKSGKGCKMVLQCTSTKSPAGTGIATAPPVSG